MPGSTARSRYNQEISGDVGWSICQQPNIIKDEHGCWEHVEEVTGSLDA